MSQHKITDVNEISAGERILTEVEGREVVIFNVENKFYAYLNWCAHQSGPCGEGTVSGTVDANYDSVTGKTKLEWTNEGEILSCPWHGWEYDILSGKCLSNKSYSIPSYPVEVKNDEIFVTL